MNQLISKIVVAVLFAFLLAGAVQGVNLTGTIYATTTIIGTNQLTGNVTCTAAAAPCIQFGAPNTVLNLNGFTITGDFPSSCSGQTAIDTNQYNYAKVRGPGLITLFSGDGVDVTGSNSDVNHVAITFMGGNGIGVGGANNTVLLNSISFFSLCSGTLGNGITVQGTGKNQIQQNVITGSLFFTQTTAILTSSNNNTILENNVSGNWVGIAVSDGSVSNVIQANQAVGNLSGIATSSTPAGDIYDNNPAKSNTYIGNLCQTSFGTGAPVCPRLPAGLIGNPIVLQNSQH